MAVKDYDALYYPYVHVRDVDWLKRNLLLFPRIGRMIPEGFAPGDSPEIAEFAKRSGRHRELLSRIPLHSVEVVKAVRNLEAKFKERIERDGKEQMVGSFGAKAAEKLRKRGDKYGFQYQVKKAPDLSQWLLDNDLAWNPQYVEPHWPAEYVQVHPHVGEAIMTTLAVACAQDLGMLILTDNGPLHRCLAESDLESVFDTWIDHGGAAPPSKDKHYERKLAIAVCERLDVSKVTPKSIVALHEEWEPRRRFLERIRQLADTIPPMENEAEQQERIQTLANEVISEWQRERLRLSKIVRDMFPAAAAGAFKDIGKDFARLLMLPATGAAAAVASTHDWTTATSGVVIGIVAEGIKSTLASVQASKSGPYRYLSMAQKAGVGFVVGV